MTFLQRAAVILVLAGIAGIMGLPILAIMFTVAGLLILDGVIIGAILRTIFRRKRE